MNYKADSGSRVIMNNNKKATGWLGGVTKTSCSLKGLGLNFLKIFPI